MTSQEVCVNANAQVRQEETVISKAQKESSHGASWSGWNAIQSEQDSVLAEPLAGHNDVGNKKIKDQSDGGLAPHFTSNDDSDHDEQANEANQIYGHPDLGGYQGETGNHIDKEMGRGGERVE